MIALNFIFYLIFILYKKEKIVPEQTEHILLLKRKTLDESMVMIAIFAS